MTSRRVVAAGIGAHNTRPDELIPAARAAEAVGFDEIWVAEDSFLTGGIASAAVALGATERIRVGLGIMPVYARHPAHLAMDVTAVAGAYPGRFTLGLGSGVPAWLDQVGISYPRPKASTRAAASAIRRLLGGETLTEDVEFFFNNVSMEYPIGDVVQIFVAAMGPQMLEESGRWADGTVFSMASANPEYVQFALERIAAGRLASGRKPEEHSTVAIVPFAVDDDPVAARNSLRPWFTHLLRAPGLKTDLMGISDELRTIIERDPANIGWNIPDEWINAFAVCGTPSDCARAIDAIFDTGVDVVSLHPQTGSDFVGQIEAFGRDGLPSMKGRS